MLKRLHLENFTVFADADFEFVPGLNVLVGTNGTGKSHVLKVGYAVETTRYDINKRYGSISKSSPGAISLAWAEMQDVSLSRIFSVAQLIQLFRWGGEGEAEIDVKFETDRGVLIEIASARIQVYVGSAGIKADSALENEALIAKPVFIPARDVLTLSWILPTTEQLIIPVEKNYLDLLNQLRLLPLRSLEKNSVVTALKDIIGGEIQAEGDIYSLVDKSGRRVSTNMMAEGLRKFGTLQKLLANGSLTEKSTLYWDEPEANLNPALLQKLAAILAELARQGFQIILATHSTDLLKEFHILSRQKDAVPLPIKYFGLNARPGEATTIVATDNFEHLPDVVALEVELKQADELEEIFIREDREYYANHPGEQPSL